MQISMLFIICRIFSLAAVLAIGNSDPEIDPCDNSTYTTLHEDWRNIHDPVVDTAAHCDANITRRWYRFINNGGDDMPVTPPPPKYCGTDNPVWLNGSLPTVAEGQVNRSVCLVTPGGNESNTTWNIQVKNCSGYYVYELQQTPSCSAAYCIGTRSRCATGHISPTGYEPCHRNVSGPLFNGTANLTVSVGSKQTLTNSSGNISTVDVAFYLFTCAAPPVYDGEGKNLTQFTIQYRYEWIMKGKTLITELLTHNVHNISEDELTNASIKYFPGQDTCLMGNYLTCRISVNYSNLNGSHGTDIVEASYFLGVQILTKNITLYKDESDSSANVQLKSTFPILCQSPNSSCFLNFVTFIPQPPTGDPLSCLAKTYLDDVVFQSPVTGSPCGFRSPAANWTQMINFKIFASTLSGYTTYTRAATYQIYIQVTVNPSQPRWCNYTIGPITVVVIDNSTQNGYNPNANCHALWDPHMKTFDDKYYEMQQPGEYVMYRHKKLPIAVHAFIMDVPGATFSRVCGIAVQSGSDVIVHDECNAGQPKRIKVYNCSDNGLKEDIQGETHTILLPTGTKIVLSMGPYPGIHIYASRLDFQQTSGLCGTFDGDGTNDMVLKDGSYSKTSDFSDFAQSWRILSKNNSLYFGKRLNNFTSWTKLGQNYCVCRGTVTSAEPTTTTTSQASWAANTTGFTSEETSSETTTTPQPIIATNTTTTTTTTGFTSDEQSSETTTEFDTEKSTIAITTEYSTNDATTEITTFEITATTQAITTTAMPMTSTILHITPSYTYTTSAPDVFCWTYERTLSDPNYSACLDKNSSSGYVDHEPTDFPESFNKTIVVDTSWKNGWNQQKATDHCTKFLTNTAQYATCSSLPSVDVQGQINTCVSDIMISGTESFSVVHQNAMLTACQNTLQNDQTLWTNNKETGVVQLPQILLTFCPSACSGHGTCNNGNCVCDTDYTGSDCSGKLTHVPVLFPLPNNGLCDVRQRDCLSTIVFGDQFINSGNLSCLLREFVVKDVWTIASSFKSTTPAVFFNDQKISCNIPQIQGNVTGFVVSVSNTLNAYSTTQHLVVYDGNCVACSSDQICQPKTGFCVIEGVCYNETELKPGSTFFMCDSGKNDDSTLAITIGLLVPGLTVLVVVTVVIIVLKMKSKNRAKRTVSSDWTPFRPESAPPYQGMIDHAYQMDDRHFDGEEESPFDKDPVQIPPLSTIMLHITKTSTKTRRGFLSPLPGKEMPHSVHHS